MARRISRRTFLTASGLTAAAAATGALLEWQSDDDERAPGLSPTPDGGPTGLLTPTADATDTPRVDETVDGYVAVAPRVLRSGQVENISFALFRDDDPARSTVTTRLSNADGVVAEARGWVAGRGALALSLPRLVAGEYTLNVE